MKLAKENLDNLKNQIIEILYEFKNYYNLNSSLWDEENKSMFNQMVGTIIITEKKITSIESIIQKIENYQDNILELLEIEIEEVEIIIDYYYEIFVNKKGV